MKNVSGGPTMPNRLAIASPGSIAAGQLAPIRARNARAASERSWKTIPTIASPSPSCAAAAEVSRGNSSTHGPHQLAQKLTITGRPRRSARRTGFPSRSANEKAGAGSPTRTTMGTPGRASSSAPHTARIRRGAIAAAA